MRRLLVPFFLCTILLIGCSGTTPQSGGGYYKDDGPGRKIPANIEAIPDAIPQLEAHAPANRRPYVVFGKRYVPISDERPFRQTGIASWYGRKFHGNKTANGEIYDMYAMTAAHPTLPLPSYARVTHAKSGKSVIVRINDRGPFHSSRIIDLSYVAAAKLDLIHPGSGPVIVEAITNDDIRNNAYHRHDAPTATAMPIPQATPPAAAPTLMTSAPAARMVVHTPPDADEPIRHTTSVPDTTTAVPDRTRPDALAALDLSDHSPAIFLQFGAFSAHENAHQLALSLNQEIAHIEHRRAEVTSSANLHRVHIGPYGSRAQAVNAAARIETETGRTASYTTLNVNSRSREPERTALSL